MSSAKSRIVSIAFVLVLGLSGLSFGFLVGRSHQMQATEQATAQQAVMAASSTVETTSTLFVKAVHGFRQLLIK